MTQAISGIKGFFGKMTFWKAVFWAIIAIGIYATYMKFFHGIGAISNLSDGNPWGLWISFDILCGVALAAGGFVVAGSVYIFNLDQYRPVLRPTILTAFLGYILVCFALMYDLGKPWNIWHVVIMWNTRSVMFEVGWCVILYSLVLALEFSPIIFEKFRLEGPLRIIHTITIPLVIIGVILSSLHQSSLGTLFLISPNKVYPLWYSATLPFLFFTSAVAVGPAMVVIESFLSSRAFNREIEMPILSKLGRVTAVALMVYLVLKIEDIKDYKLWEYLFMPRIETLLYWLEIVIGVIVPMVMLLMTKIRTNKKGLYYSMLFVVLGIVFNRMNVGLTSMARSNGVDYFPTFLEVCITLMIVAIGFAVFTLTIKYFPVFEKAHPDETTTSQH